MLDLIGDGVRLVEKERPRTRNLDVAGVRDVLGNVTRVAYVKVRAGLHTGECELLGADIGGIAVHIAARVASMAGADEVFVSSTVKDLVAGSGIQFEARGSHALKGVPGEWALFMAQA